MERGAGHGLFYHSGDAPPARDLPRRYFRAYLEACARQGGKAPENLEEFLPWNWSTEKKAAWRTQEQAP